LQLPLGSLIIALALRRYNQRLFAYVLLAPPICASDTPAVLSSANPNYFYMVGADTRTSGVKLNRSEAIRRLVELGLKAKGK
jgi:hypothetical protein